MRHYRIGCGAEQAPDRDEDGSGIGKIAENKATAADQQEYQRRRNELIARYEFAKEGYGSVSDEISERQRKRKIYMWFISGLQKLNGFSKGFEEERWTSLFGHAIVYIKNDIRFTFKMGTRWKSPDR